MGTNYIGGEGSKSQGWNQFFDNYTIGRFFDSIFDVVQGEDEFNSAKWIEISDAWAPARASVRQFIHFGQIMQSGSFQEFDFGFNENKKRYNRYYAQPLNVESIIGIKIALFAGSEDGLATVGDATDIDKKLKDDVGIFFKIIKNFDHSSFMTGKDMSYLDDVLMLLKNHATTNEQEPSLRSQLDTQNSQSLKSYFDSFYQAGATILNQGTPRSLDQASTTNQSQLGYYMSFAMIYGLQIYILI